MIPKFSPEDIAGIECKHAIYMPPPQGVNEDYLGVKEYVTLKDGRRFPRFRLIKNYQRDFYVTLPKWRNHTDKKEWEDVDKLKKYTCAQHELLPAIGRANGRSPAPNLAMAASSPFLYGCDITTPVLYKHSVRKRWPGFISDNKAAPLDIETDVINGTKQIIMITLSCGKEVVHCVLKSFLKNVPNPEQAIQDCFEEELGHIKRERGINLEIYLMDTPAQMVKKIFERAHEISPDFISVWNLNFDLPKILEALKAEGVDPRDVLSDPSVPKLFRDAYYKEGNSKRETATGGIFTVHPADRWHWMHTPASFIFLDAMCVYKKLRATKGNEPSYSLDAILNKILGVRKLKFAGADGLIGLKWHQKMQKDFPVQYCVYNLFDCIGMELLDDKTTDLKRVISVLIEHSDYSKFPSQPRRTCDDLHFFVQDHGKIIATTSRQMVDDNDKFVVGMDNWIVTLSSYLVEDGLKVLSDLPDHATMLFGHVADCDAVGTYPTLEVVMNISKETTLRELCRFRGIPLDVQRIQGINLTGGTTNAYEIMRNLYGVPSFDELSEMYDEEQKVLEQA